MLEFLIRSGGHYNDGAGDQKEQIIGSICPLHPIEEALGVHHFCEKRNGGIFAGQGLVYVRLQQIVILEICKALILFHAEFIDFLVLRLVRQVFGCDEIVALLKLYEDAPKIARR